MRPCHTRNGSPTRNISAVRTSDKAASLRASPYGPILKSILTRAVFFSGTLETLRTAYVRPRFDGFIRFFEAAGIEVNRCLKNQVADAQLIEWLNKSFAEKLALSEARA